MARTPPPRPLPPGPLSREGAQAINDTFTLVYAWIGGFEVAPPLVVAQDHAGVRLWLDPNPLSPGGDSPPLFARLTATAMLPTTAGGIVPFYSWKKVVWQGGPPGAWADAVPALTGTNTAREENDHPSVQPTNPTSGAVVQLWSVAGGGYEFFWDDANPVYTTAQTVTWNNSFQIYVGVNLVTYQAGSTTTYNLASYLTQVIFTGLGLLVYNANVELCATIFWCYYLEPILSTQPNNDWEPTGAYDANVPRRLQQTRPVHLLLGGSGGSTVTGMKPTRLPDGTAGPEVRVLINVGLPDVILSDASAGSAAVNTFFLPDGLDMTLKGDGDAVIAWFSPDSHDPGWNLLAFTCLNDPFAGNTHNRGMVAPTTALFGCGAATDFYSAGPNANRWRTSYLIKIDAADSTPGYFALKVLPGTGITMPIANVGGNETVTINATVNNTTGYTGTRNIVEGVTCSGGTLTVTKFAYVFTNGLLQTVT